MDILKEISLFNKANIQPKKNELNQCKYRSGKEEVLNKLIIEIFELENRNTGKSVH